MEHRTLDEPLMTFSIPDEIARIKQSPQWSEAHKGSITLAKNDNLRIVLMVMGRGTVLHEHQTDGPLTISLTEGSLRFDAGRRHSTLTAGQLVALHGGIRHAVEALEDSAFVITIVHRP